MNVQGNMAIQIAEYTCLGLYILICLFSNWTFFLDIKINIRTEERRGYKYISNLVQLLHFEDLGLFLYSCSQVWDMVPTWNDDERTYFFNTSYTMGILQYDVLFHSLFSGSQKLSVTPFQWKLHFSLLI